LGLLLLAWFAPAIVAHSPLRQQVAPTLVPDFEGPVHIGSASLGWFSPVVLRDVTVHDAAEQPLLTAGEIASEKSLLGLLSNLADLGGFRIARPHLHVVLRNDGSNVEDALAPLLAPQDEPSSPLGVSVEIVEGTVDVTEAARGRKWKVSALSVSLSKPLDTAKPLALTLDATVPNSKQTGTLAAELTCHVPTDADTESVGHGQIKLRCNALPLEIAQSVLARFVPGVQVTGRLTSGLECSWEGAGNRPTFIAAGRVDADGLGVAAPSWLGTDRPRADYVRAVGQVSYRDGRLQFAPLTIDSDLAKVEVRGGANVAELADKPFLAWLERTLNQEDYRLDARADLARLAQVLPGTLRIRSGTKVTSGEIHVTLESQVQEGHRRWQGGIETSNLTAVADGRRITWDQPITITVAARQTNNGPAIEQFVCRSDFLHLSGNGTLRQASLTGGGDLDRLTAQLGQFIDMGEFHLAGQLQANVRCQRSEEDRLQVNGTVDVENFQLVVPGHRPLREQRLVIGLAADGVLQQQTVERIDHANVVVSSGGDRLDLRLAEPVAQPSLQTAWPVTFDLRGELAQWLVRVQPWMPLQGWDLGGAIVASAAATVSADGVSIGSSAIDIQQFHLVGNGLYVSEPAVHLETTGSWEGAKRRFTSKATTLACTSVAVLAEDVDVQFPSSGVPAIAADVEFRGDLAGIAGWISDPQVRPTTHVAGQTTGKVQLLYGGGATQAEWSAELIDLVYATRPADGTPQPSPVLVTATPPWQTVWMEKKVLLSGQGSYHHSDDALRLARFRVVSDELQLRGKGKIDKLTTRRETDLTGQIDYDLESIAAKLRPYLGEGARISGRDSREFAVRGPLVFFRDASVGDASSPNGAARAALGAADASEQVFVWPKTLSAGAGIGWTSVDLFGVMVGRGEVTARLDNGVVSIGPLDFPVSGGRMKASPRIVLNTTPAMLIVDKGRVIENVKITPQMCDSWLKYVAPLLADSTRIDGHFSLDLHGAQVPLATPPSGDVGGSSAEQILVAGDLSVHSTQVRPGPLAQQMIFIGQQVRALLEKRLPPDRYIAPRDPMIALHEQNVRFWMVEDGVHHKRRVHHRGLEVDVQGVMVRTSGWVGVDQSISLLAEVPIRDEWVRDDRLLAPLKGQVLQIPIGGQLSKPQLDRRVLRDLARQFLRDAAGRLIEDNLNRALEDLFRPRD